MCDDEKSGLSRHGEKHGGQEESSGLQLTLYLYDLERDDTIKNIAICFISQLRSEVLHV